MDKISFKNSGKLISLADSIETCGVVQLFLASGTVSISEFTAENCFNNLKKNYKSILLDFPHFSS